MEASNLPSGPSVPVWVVLPGTPGGGQVDPDYDISADRPTHPIVLPPDVPEGEPGVPTHPIVLPPELVDPGWGIEEGAHPDNTLPGIPSPPVDPDYGVDEGTGPVRPTHPIYIPVYPDNSLPEGSEQVGGLEFYQRKTVGIKWDAALLAPAVTVGIYVVEGETATRVRTVANTGASSVTYPQDWTGQATFRVAGADSYCEGSVTVS